MAEGGEVWEARETLMNVVTAVRRGAAAPGGSGVAAPASAGPGMGVQPLTPRDVQEGSSNPMSICTDLLFFFSCRPSRIPVGCSLPSCCRKRTRGVTKAVDRFSFAQVTVTAGLGTRLRGT